MKTEEGGKRDGAPTQNATAGGKRPKVKTEKTSDNSTSSVRKEEDEKKSSKDAQLNALIAKLLQSALPVVTEHCDASA